MPKIIFTGGGSAGHVTLNLALIPYFSEHNWDISYIGSHQGIEKDLINKLDNVQYYSVATGKLRRYFSWQNFLDALKIPYGCIQAYFIVRKINPDIIFSKGGFVSFPVVIAGFLNRKKIYMHESDVTTGLANKLSLPFVNTYFTTFAETSNRIKYKNKINCVGPILSNRLFNGDKIKGAKFCKLDANKPTIMIIGGSLGAKSLNAAIKDNLDKLLNKYQIIHIVGKNDCGDIITREGYCCFEYVNEELKDLFALSDVVISRAGSNSIFELRSLSKPMILVPLPATASRGEQSLNAKNFAKQGFAEIIKDEDINDIENLLSMINKVYDNRLLYQNKMINNPMKSTTNEELCKIICQE